MTIAAADPAGALALYLLTQVSDLVDGRVFRPELPGAEASSMPRACIVIRRAGGYQLFAGTNQPIGDPRLDLFCYGETWFQAENIAGAVVPALRALRTSTWRLDGGPGTRLNWARISGGPNPFDDPDENWPCSLVTAQVAHYELAIP